MLSLWNGRQKYLLANPTCIGCIRSEISNLRKTEVVVKPQYNQPQANSTRIEYQTKKDFEEIWR